jgi:hypothetical protein
MKNNNVKNIGFWSAVLSVFFAIGYCIAQLLSTSKILPYPHDMFWLFLPSLFLASTFVVAMVCLHYSVEANQKIWTALGVAFALLYAPLVSIVYFTQLTVVLPALLRGELNETHVLYFPGRSFLMAVDCLGYFFMSVSTLFAAFAFRKNSKSKWLYRSLLWNGILMPVLMLAFFYPVFYYVGAVWMFTFPLSMVNAAKYFTTKEMELNFSK